MKTYLLNLTPEQKATLRKHLLITDDSAEDSLTSISEPDLQSVLTALNMRIADETIAPDLNTTIIRLEPVSAEEQRAYYMQREQFVAACLNSLQQERLGQACQSSLEALRCEYEHRLMSYCRDLRSTDSSNALTHDPAKMLSGEFDKIIAMPKVRKLYFEETPDGTELTIETIPLKCLNPISGQWHELGAFDINIILSGKQDVVRWFHTKGGRGKLGSLPNMQAPNVHSNGKALLLGNTKQLIVSLVARMELAAACDAAIQYLETYEYDDPSWTRLKNWPAFVNSPARTLPTTIWKKITGAIQNEFQRRRFVALCKKALPDRADRGGAPGNSASIFEQNIVESAMKIAEFERDWVEAVMKPSNPVLEREYDNLMRLQQGSPKVKNLELDIDTMSLKLFTNLLYCTDDRSGKIHEIGEFRIEIKLNGMGSDIRWHNLTRRVRSWNNREMNAPHVFDSGQGCLSGTEHVFDRILAKCQFTYAALLAIKFIESVNTADLAGQGIVHYPVVD